MKRGWLMRKIFAIFSIFAIISSLILVGCNQNKSNNENSSSDQNKSSSEAPASGPITINKEISDNQLILSKGPHGETAVSAKTLELTEEEIAKIKQGNYKAAIVMHYAGNDWSTAQIDGLKATFERMGIEVVAVTDADFKSEKQVSDIETVLAKNPDIIVSIPVDPVSTAEAYKKSC